MGSNNQNYILEQRRPGIPAPFGESPDLVRAFSSPKIHCALSLIACIGFFSCCEDPNYFLWACGSGGPCNHQSEPLCVIRFVNSEPHYTDVFAINGRKTWPGDFRHLDNTNDPNYQGWTIGVPMSIVSDTTTYVLEGYGKSDTLSFSYLRNVAFQSKGCGFTITLSSFQRLELSTFEKVEFNTRSLPDEVKRNIYEVSILD